MPEYDHRARVYEEIHLLEQELAESGVREDLGRLADRLGVPHDVLLAGLFRAARRTGYTLRVMLEELARQEEREAAAQKGAERRNAGGSGGGI